MNLLQFISSNVGQVWAWCLSYFGSLGAVVHDTFCVLFRESLSLTWNIMASIPIPDSLAQWTWPSTPTVFQAVFSALGVAQAMAIITAAFTVKMSLKLIPLILAA